jgi:hypothetical protein
VPLPLRPELFADFHMGAIGGCSGRNLDPWMMRRSFRFSQYPIDLIFTFQRTWRIPRRW